MMRRQTIHLFFMVLTAVTTARADNPFSETEIALYRAFPSLQNKIPYRAFCDLPTPVQRASHLEQALGVGGLYVKRDDLTGREYKPQHRLFGGNKARKAEFLLADALARGYTSAITFGCVGSNHAAAMAMYAHMAGLQMTCLLLPQPNSEIVRRNLAIMSCAGARLMLSKTTEERENVERWLVEQEMERSGMGPCIIPTGGSSIVGMLAYVNAAFELKEQIDAGLLPEPDCLYVAVGSGGTMAGLVVGCRAAGLKTRVIGVLVEKEEYPGYRVAHIAHLCSEINRVLSTLEPAFPALGITDKQIKITTSMVGHEYGAFTLADVGVKLMVQRKEGITLDGVYTAKACGALIADVLEGRIPRESVILFWNTFCSDCSLVPYDFDYHRLPIGLHTYFEQDVQPCDFAC